MTETDHKTDSKLKRQPPHPARGCRDCLQGEEAAWFRDSMRSRFSDRKLRFHWRGILWRHIHISSQYKATYS